jgi:hypothetical protein
MPFTPELFQELLDHGISHRAVDALLSYWGTKIAEFETPDELRRIPDEDLKALNGIGIEGLTQIRSAFPYKGPPIYPWKFHEVAFDIAKLRTDLRTVPTTDFPKSLTAELASLVNFLRN